MGSDVEQEDVALGDEEGQRDAVGVGQPYGVLPLELAPERLQAKARLEWVVPQVIDEPLKPVFQVPMLPEEEAGSAIEFGRRIDAVAHSSSASR